MAVTVWLKYAVLVTVGSALRPRLTSVKARARLLPHSTDTSAQPFTKLEF
jgi:hypothetical protein